MPSRIAGSQESGVMLQTSDLQGRELNRDVHIKPPKEAKVEKGKVWKLRKCLYGLNDASRQFYLSVREVLVLSGCKQSAGDPSFFALRKDGELLGVIVSHIDDFLHAGSPEFETTVIRPLTEKFSAGKVEEIEFSYVGFQIKQARQGITLDQNQYVNSLEAVKWPKEAIEEKQRELTSTELTDYRSLVGSLNWCIRGTRPDLAFELIELSMKLKGALVEDYLRANKVLKRIKNTEALLMFPDLGGFDDLELIVFSDASFANLGGVGSAMGYIIFCRRNEKTCPITWRAIKVKRVVTSTLAAETLALATALGDAFYQRSFLAETLGVAPKIRAYVDNKGLVRNIQSTKLVEDRRLNLDLGVLKEMLQKGEVESIEWCAHEDMLADSMTKRGAAGEKLQESMRKGRLN